MSSSGQDQTSVSESFLILVADIPSYEDSGEDKDKDEAISAGAIFQSVKVKKKTEAAHASRCAYIAQFLISRAFQRFITIYMITNGLISAPTHSCATCATRLIWAR